MACLKLAISKNTIGHFDLPHDPPLAGNNTLSQTTKAEDLREIPDGQVRECTVVMTTRSHPNSSHTAALSRPLVSP